MDEIRDPLQAGNVLVFPNTEVLRRDAGIGQHRGCFGEHESRAPDRPAAQMDQVPIIAKAVLARILAHGRNKDPVGNGDPGELDRGE